MNSLTAERRIKLTLQYDGGGFFGWQTQAGLRTVQTELESALSRLTNRAAAVTAAGRTDRGVHATGQVVSLLVPEKWTVIELRRALNAVLPDDMWIVAAAEVAPEFHARYSATARSYTYRIGTTEEAWSPFQRRWCWALRETLSLEALNEAARHFIGTHSFEAFAKAGQPERGYTCALIGCEWSSWQHGVELAVSANRFLHHMVRYMVGTMVDVALQRRPIHDIDRLLAGQAGLDTSPPAPPDGLFLSHVEYP